MLSPLESCTQNPSILKHPKLGSTRGDLLLCMWHHPSGVRLYFCESHVKKSRREGANFGETGGGGGSLRPRLAKLSFKKRRIQQNKEGKGKPGHLSFPDGGELNQSSAHSRGGGELAKPQLEKKFLSCWGGEEEKMGGGEGKGFPYGSPRLLNLTFADSPKRATASFQDANFQASTHEFITKAVRAKGSEGKAGRPL